MAIAHKTVISFGLVAIPISMYTATQDNDIHFNQLHEEDNARIKYKKTCSHCGKEVIPKDLIKGYEYDKDHYVVVTDDDLEKIKTEKEKSIQILHFAQLNQISPIFYDKTYQAIPEAELTMANALINSMVTPFNPSEYKDEYQIKLRELLETKIAGKEIVASKSEAPSNIINLMDALKASIEQNKVKDNPKPKRKRISKGA